MGNIPYAEQIRSFCSRPFFQLPSKMEIFCGSKKMMPLLFSLTLVMKTFQKVLGTSRLSFNCLQNGEFVVQKNDAIFILSGLS
jgi:hypothetical protein